MPFDSIFRAMAIANWYRATRSFRSISRCLLPTGIGIAFTGAIHSSWVFTNEWYATLRAGIGVGVFSLDHFRMLFPPCHTAGIGAILLFLPVRCLFHYRPAVKTSDLSI